MLRPAASMPCFSMLLVWILPVCVFAQNFTVPDTWRKPTSTRSRNERLSVAQAAVQSMTESINTSNGTDDALTAWQSASLLGSVAQFDYISNGQSYRNFVHESIAAYQSGHPDFFDSRLQQNLTTDPLMWGLAAYYASRAYNDTDLLGTAVHVWDITQAYLVSDEDGAAGSQHTRNGSFVPHCTPNSNATSAGAILTQASLPTDYTSSAETVGAYVALSAHLWNSTGNSTYLASAEQSALFMYNHMYSPDLQIVWNSFNLQTCQANELQWTHNQGLLMEGLSILSSSPVATSSTWASLLQTLVSSTIPCPAWTIPTGDAAGILNETSPGAQPSSNDVALTYRDVYMRSLYEVWSRTDPSEPMALFIQSFMIVQYNALLDLASKDGGNFSSVWAGPQASQMLDWSQSASLDVLSGTIDMISNSTGPGTSHKALSGGDIAGIVVGVVAVFIIGLLGAIIVQRRLRRAHPEKDTAAMLELDPFPPGTPASDYTEGDADLPAGYTLKDRSGYGPARLVPGRSAGQLTRRSAANPSAQPPTTDSSYDPDTPVVASETSITRLIYRVLSVMQTQEDPPAYAGHQVLSER
ncbi:unnamed protein product [Peniophora sp. CBMAI 1063]|nr:unnamed protein product [Peniophora sp. CBMAI 1063]